MISSCFNDSRCLILYYYVLSPLYDFFAYSAKTIKWLFNLVYNSLSGNYRRWYFMDDNAPLLCPFVNEDNMTQVNWEYNDESCTLTRTNTVITLKSCIPWLSANCILNGTKYSMDDLLSKFNYYTDDIHTITPRIILSVWSIHSGIWFSLQHNITFDIIDNNGDNHILSINEEMPQSLLKMVYAENDDSEDECDTADASDTSTDISEESTDISENETSDQNVHPVTPPLTNEFPVVNDDIDDTPVVQQPEIFDNYIKDCAVIRQRQCSFAG